LKCSHWNPPLRPWRAMAREMLLVEQPANFAAEVRLENRFRSCTHQTPRGVPRLVWADAGSSFTNSVEIRLK